MGHKCELFVNGVDKNLICPICYEVFQDPVNCKSGHTFCDVCIQQWLQNSNRCPMDNKMIHGASSLSRNLALKGVIDNLDVCCNPSVTQEEPRCIWRGRLEELEGHRKKCTFQEVQCPNVNCDQWIQKREMEKHDEICGFKNVECEECSLVLIRQDMEIHKEDDCPEAIIPCPNKCTNAQGNEENIKRKDLKDHINNTCNKTEVTCPFQTQGCPVCVYREDVDKHVQDNMAAHMVLLAKKNDKLEGICFSLKEENVKLTHQNARLRDDLNKVKDDLHSYIWTIDNYPTQCNRHSSGSYFRSPNFWLCGYLWYLRVYPNGDNDSNGLLTLNLCMSTEGGSRTLRPVVSSAKVVVSYRLSVISQIYGTDNVTSRKQVIFAKNESLIHREVFVITEEDLATFCDKINNNSLTIKCTISVC